MQEGFIEIHPSLPFTKEGDLKLAGFFEISPSPSFIKRGVEKGGVAKGGDLKLEGKNYVSSSNQ
ncbi:MAG TPA: hypothetical protein PL060_06450 [bacterium]|nr:hypothetical protein [bacterium]